MLFHCRAVECLTRVHEQLVDVQVTTGLEMLMKDLETLPVPGTEYLSDPRMQAEVDAHLSAAGAGDGDGGDDDDDAGAAAAPAAGGSGRRRGK